jgi:hypothetical protein
MLGCVAPTAAPLAACIFLGSPGSVDTIARQTAMPLGSESSRSTRRPGVVVHGAPLEGTIPPVLATLDTDTSLAGVGTVTGLVTMSSETEHVVSSLAECSARSAAANASRAASWTARLNALACVGASCCPGPT